MKRIALAWVLFCWMPALASGPTWRQATVAELRQIIPARAPVGKERIETEFRAASGITDGGRFVAGVFMIVTGYEAEGKYTHFIITQVPIRVGGTLQLEPGEYVFGSKRVDGEVVEVKFYEAASERFLGTVLAKLDTRRTGVRQFYISPPAYGSGKGFFQFGRFVFDYKLSQ